MILRTFTCRATPALCFALACLLLLASCGHEAAPARSSATWIAGHAAPAFDPDGPPDALRSALERQLSMGLIERDSSGALRNAIADSIGCSADSLTWTFRLRAGLRFTDRSPVRSSHVRDALAGGLARSDHATRTWLLSAIRGVDKVRAGRPLPALGIETPDERRLVLKLARPDRRLLEKLAVSGVSTPWKRRNGSWIDAVGVGPYRVGAENAQRSLTLVGVAPVAGVRPLVDTLHVRFVLGAARVHAVMRLQHADLVWPLPPGTLAQPLPEGWSVVRAESEPARRLLLVLRADLPPLHRIEARQSLVRAINREELLAGLGAGGVPIRRWLPGAQVAYEWPALESPSEQHSKFAQASRNSPEGAFRRESFHVVLAYDADLSGAEIARALQGQLAKAGHYAELRPLRGGAAVEEALAEGGAQTLLVESQAPLPGAEAELAQLVAPLRGPVVGSFRTGWRTRDFDRWVAVPQPAPGFDPDAIQRRLGAERVALPLATLPWRMVLRNAGARPRVHPAFGPGWTVAK